MSRYLVFDWGGTFLKYALMNDSAEILEQGKVRTPPDEEGSKESLFLIIDEVIRTIPSDISGIAVSMPGIIDNVIGHCHTAGKLFYLSGCTIGKELRDRYGYPVSVENDGKCAALAELWKGSLAGCKNAAVVVIGTGIGGGLIIDGRLHRGTHFSAGELSFLCEKPDHFEMDESFWGATGGAVGFVNRAAEAVGADPSDFDGVKAFEMANSGDERVLAELRRFTDRCAAHFYNLNMVLDLEKIAVGGGISRQDILHRYLKSSMDHIAEVNALANINPFIPYPELVKCTFFNEANLIGALYHFLYEIHE
ncbi:MAG: ROK family protein [Lachnospiraceae bacterium]|nr:ROK family protein [Lachnospiraceae bacterium]